MKIDQFDVAVIKRFGDFFIECNNIYERELKEIKSPILIFETFECVDYLERSYNDFVYTLRDLLEGVNDHSERDVIYYMLHNLLPSAMFNHNLSQLDYKQKLIHTIAETENEIEGQNISIIRLVNLLYKSTTWFDAGDKDYLSSFYIREVLKDLRSNDLRQGECYVDTSKDDLVNEIHTPNLPIDEILKLELYEFFQYCRDRDIPELYIRNYLEKHTGGFNSEQTKAIWRDFWPWFEAEKEDFYCDRNRISQAVERNVEAGLEVPLIPDTPFTPRPKRDNQTEEQYQNFLRIQEEAHKNQVGQIDVKKLLGTESCELMGLFTIKNILVENLEKNNNSLNSEDAPLDDEGVVENQIKHPISRDAVKYLFTELMNKGVINSMSHTDLANHISEFTTYSAEQLRRNNDLTENAKKKLKELLHSIIERI